MLMYYSEQVILLFLMQSYRLKKTNLWTQISNIFANMRRNTKKGLYRSKVLFCDPHGARTHDPNIKSVVLYQLS